MAALLSFLLPFAASGQDDIEPPPASEVLGTILGRVAASSQALAGQTLQAVLMPPEWGRAWDRDVQQRIDTYTSRYRAALDRDPERFQEISRMARRDAVVSVLLQMQGRLGTEFGELVRPVSSEGRFEYSAVPLGEYRIVVLAERGGDPGIWMETVTLLDSIPLFVELQDRIQ